MSEQEVPDEKLGTIGWLAQLPPNVLRRVIVLGWAIMVSLLLAYILGALTMFGFSQPFASAVAVQNLQNDSSLQSTVLLMREMRDDYNQLCRPTDEPLRIRIQAEIDEWQQDFQRRNGHYYLQQPCPRQ